MVSLSCSSSSPRPPRGGPPKVPAGPFLLRFDTLDAFRLGFPSQLLSFPPTQSPVLLFGFPSPRQPLQMGNAGTPSS